MMDNMRLYIYCFNFLNFQTFYLFYDGENVEGEVLINLKKPGQKLEHQGIRIDFIGQIGLIFKFILFLKIYSFHQKYIMIEVINMIFFIKQKNWHVLEIYFKIQNLNFVLLMLVNQLIFLLIFFNFINFQYETYMGSNVKLRYFLRVTIMRRLTDIVHEMEV